MRHACERERPGDAEEPGTDRAAQQMAAAVEIPVVADCDTGYGNSNNVMRMVRTFEAAGVSDRD